jgi:hypothetical protein
LTGQIVGEVSIDTCVANERIDVLADHTWLGGRSGRVVHTPSFAGAPAETIRGGAQKTASTGSCDAIVIPCLDSRRERGYGEGGP